MTGETPADDGDALLIYPFGTSDVQLMDDDRRGSNQLEYAELLRDEVASLRLRREHQQWQAVLLDELGRDIGLVPIISDVLKYLKSEQAVVSLFFFPVITRQEDSRRTDTHPLVGFLDEVVFPLLEDELGLEIHCLEPFEIRRNPWNYGVMTRLYEQEFFPVYREHLAQQEVPPTKRYFQLTTGTPGMSVGSAVFARDPSLQFLYSPRDGSTSVTELFTDRRQENTDELLGELAERLEWGAFSLALAEEGNGYTPIAGPHPEGHRLTLAEALQAWKERDYGRAAKMFDDLHQKQEGESEAPSTRVASLCRVLTGDTDHDYEAFWRAASIDSFARMVFARHLGSTEDFIFQTYVFSENCLAWGLSYFFPEVDFTEKSASDVEDVEEFVADIHDSKQFPAFRGNFHWRHEKFQGLMASARFRDNEGFETWFDAYRLLFWALNGAFDDVRNRVVHGGAALPEGRLGALLGELLEEGLEDEAAMDEFLAIAASIAACWPGADEPQEIFRRLPKLAGRLHDDIASPERLLPDETARESSLEHWSDCVLNPLRQIQEDVCAEAAEHLERVDRDIGRLAEHVDGSTSLPFEVDARAIRQLIRKQEPEFPEFLALQKALGLETGDKGPDYAEWAAVNFLRDFQPFTTMWEHNIAWLTRWFGKHPDEADGALCNFLGDKN